MEKFKYNIGDFVCPVVMDSYEHATKMVVTGRVLEEYAGHVERYYICSHFKLGDYIRQRLTETEIIAWKAKS